MAEPFRSIRLPHSFAAGAAVLVMALAVVVLAGWFTHTPVLMQVVPHLAPMQRNTAACFFLLGLAMLGASTARGRGWLGGHARAR